MILHGNIKINGREYKKGTYISPWKVYPFFLVHMGVFGASGFSMAYFSETNIGFLYLHGGIAVIAYLLFYKAFFGLDEVKWMLINALLGIFGLYSEIAIFLSWTGKDISSFPLAVHVIPFMYYVLYTFLLRQVIIEITNSREDDVRRERVSYWYLAVSMLVYLSLLVMGRV